LETNRTTAIAKNIFFIAPLPPNRLIIIIIITWELSGVKENRQDNRINAQDFFLHALGAPPPAAGSGFPLQVLGFAHANPVGFPLQSLARRKLSAYNLSAAILSGSSELGQEIAYGNFLGA
jgi:hypothetical protein